MTEHHLPLSRTDHLVITDLEGYAPHIARLIHMMSYVRNTTLRAVEGLTVQELDTLVNPEGNTIGMLLAHIAGLEEGYQGITFQGVRPDSTRAELRLGNAGRREIHSQPLERYVERLNEVRQETLAGLRDRDDQWMAHEYSPWGRDTWNNHFAWFHVMEDEIRHQGQIILLKKLIRLHRSQR